jgi:hypothetical protein
METNIGVKMVVWGRAADEAIISRLGTPHYAPLVKIVNYQQRVNINPTLTT